MDDHSIIADETLLGITRSSRGVQEPQGSQYSFGDTDEVEAHQFGANWGRMILHIFATPVDSTRIQPRT